MSADEAEQQATQLAEDYQQANLNPADRAMLDYSVTLTQRPSEIAESDVKRLRQHGFDDRKIHDLCSVVAYFAFANRIANGLGIELEQ